MFWARKWCAIKKLLLLLHFQSYFTRQSIFKSFIQTNLGHQALRERNLIQHNKSQPNIKLRTVNKPNTIHSFSHFSPCAFPTKRTLCGDRDAERARTPNKSALPLGRAGWNCAIGVKGQSERRAAAPLCNGTGASTRGLAAEAHSPAEHSFHYVVMVLLKPHAVYKWALVWAA